MFNFAWRRRPLCARKRARHVSPVTLGLLPLSVMPSFAQADNARSGVTLPSVTITASAPNLVTVDPNLPATVETVTPAQFQNWNVVNGEDMLQYMPNLAVCKRFIGDLNSIIAFRGTSNSHSACGLVYADGMLLSNLLGNSYSFPPEWSMVSPDEIQQASVIYGPFSAAYPGNSLGATVLITTRMPTHFQAGADVKGFTQRSTITAGVHYSGRQYNTLTNTDTNPDVFGGTSTYTVADVKYTFKPSKLSEIGIGLDNLFDERYFVYHPYPGRTFYVEGKLRM
jgi:iron complex outermembrane receptor protein